MVDSVRYYDGDGVPYRSLSVTIRSSEDMLAARVAKSRRHYIGTLASLFRVLTSRPCFQLEARNHFLTGCLIKGASSPRASTTQIAIILPH